MGNRIQGIEPQAKAYLDEDRKHAGYEVINGVALINVFDTLVRLTKCCLNSRLLHFEPKFTLSFSVFRLALV